MCPKLNKFPLTRQNFPKKKGTLKEESWPNLNQIAVILEFKLHLGLQYSFNSNMYYAIAIQN